MRWLHTTTWVAVAAFAMGAIGLARSPAPAPNSMAFVVHEWGTFSSFSGSDGKLLTFFPSNADVPQFVHSSVRFAKGSFGGLISLETPVVYFYSQKPVTASVKAQFRGGVFTEWYPEASRSDNNATITWPEVRIRPGEVMQFPTLAGLNHYYAARETDAAPVEVPIKKGGVQFERERYLFYRGVGRNLPTPLQVTAHGNGAFGLKSLADERIGSALLIEVAGGKIRFRRIDPMPGGAMRSLNLPPEWASVDTLKATMVRMLIEAGLFEKEAKAMVKTWESTWFTDEGTRVLYLLPSAWTDHTLPLEITPRPDVLVRVMVGRHDLLTPEHEREIDDTVRTSVKGSVPEQAAANAALAKLGRFAVPARRQAELRIQASK